MALASGDPAVLLAIERAVGHPPPFSDDELRAIDELTVEGARSLKPIEGCRHLTKLRVVGCELESTYSISELPDLRELRLHASILGDVETLSLCANLERLDVLFTSVTDAEFLWGPSKLRRVVLAGNPFTDDAWEWVLRHAERPDRNVDISNKRDWSVCRELWERAGACVGTVAGTVAMTVRPGLPRLTSNPFDALALDSHTIQHQLFKPDFSLDQLFADYAHRVQAPDLDEIVSYRVVGHAADALAWIAASPLPDDEKEALRRFVSRFPQHDFYRYSDLWLQRCEARLGHRLPAHERERDLTLAGFIPYLAPIDARVKLDAFEGASPRADRLAHVTYSLGWSSYRDGTEDAMRRADFEPIASSPEQPDYRLAMRTRDDDRRVFDYNDEDLADALRAGRDVESAVYPVYPSWAAMLGHVVSIHPAL